MDATLSTVEITALLGRGTRFEGKLCFEGRVRIDGELRGEIHGDEALVVGEGALVVGNVEAATVIIRGGRVEGNIVARTAVEVYAPGSVVGDITSPSIFIERGVEFEGRSRKPPVVADDAGESST